jgi:murein DD-endopeptidase MepM/ murein hydrolase activator NlpD
MNSGTRYYFDPETCQFVEAPRQRLRLVLRRAGAVVALATALAAALLWGLDAYDVRTPEEVALRAENVALQRQLDDVGERMSDLSQRLDRLASVDHEIYRTLLQAEPISDDVRQVGVGGADTYERFDGFGGTTSRLLRRTATTLDRLERQVALQSTSYRDLTQAAKAQQERLAQLPAIRPADGPLVSSYGMRMHPILKVRKMHAGIDIVVDVGTPVVTTGDGRILRTGRSYTYGRYVDVEHRAAGYVTRYAHLSKVARGMRRGTKVKRGDVIAYSGNSGRSTGPHLHYEVHDLEGRTLNPVQFLVPGVTPATFKRLQARSRSYIADPAAMASSDGTGDGMG